MDNVFQFKRGDSLANLYEFLVPLNKDNSGELYLVRDVTKRPFLMKICSAENQREKEIAIRLSKFSDTPGLMSVIAAGVTEDTNAFYYLMTAPDNQSLFPEYTPSSLALSLEHQPKVDPLDVSEIGLTLLKGLKILRDQGLSHREISPRHIFFVDGHPVLGGLDCLIPATSFEINKNLADLAHLLYIAYSANSMADFPSPPHDSDDAFLAKTAPLLECLKQNAEILDAVEFVRTLKSAQKHLTDTKYRLRKWVIFIFVIGTILALLCWRGCSFQ